MKRYFPRIVSILIIAVILLTAVPLSASAYDNTLEFDINGFDCKTDSGNLFVYTNSGDETRAIKADEFNFRNTKIMVFDKDGFLVEAGGDLFANSATVTGSPQEYVYVPAGGFAVAFKSSALPALRACFDTAMEGAMLYNATMSVIYEVKGSYTDGKLKIEYDAPEAASPTAKKYLFVGNSSTYFNGTPIKLKGLAQAAGAEIDVEYCTFGSAYLSEFADETHERGIALRNKLNAEKYDYVVLQDAGKCIYTDTKPQVEKLLPLIQANGAEALLYMRYAGPSTDQAGLEGAKTHHDNYTQLAKDYSLICAPAADAFVICTQKYPDIDLYADDNSHHSKEGSYLIACVWLQTYLGIDPRGNSYTAQLPEETAKALQECAVIACEEGYAYEELKDTFTDKNGNVYDNIALGKPYIPTGEPYTSASWTDTDPDGNPLGKLTDGYIASNGSDGAIGCYSGIGHTVTIDLGTVSQIRAFKTDMFGNESWGIGDPKDAKVSIAISNDGTDFRELGEAAMSDEIKPDDTWVKRDFILELGAPVMAKYVRITFNGGKFNWVSEISVYGSIPDTETSESISETESESIDSDYSYEEPENKKYTWVYWVIGIAAVGAVTAAAIVISKKKK